MANGTTTDPVSRAILAYSAYCKAVGYKSIKDEHLPPFGEMPIDRQEAWKASAAIIWDLATTGKATL